MVGTAGAEFRVVLVIQGQSLRTGAQVGQLAARHLLEKAEEIIGNVELEAVADYECAVRLGDGDARARCALAFLHAVLAGFPGSQADVEIDFRMPVEWGELS